MAIRTTPEEVGEIIELAPNSEIKIAAFIEAASGLVDHVELKDTDNVLSTTVLATIERWLAAHFYAHRDQQFSQESKGKTSGTYQGKTGMGLSSTQWGQAAMTLDLTGELAKLDQQSDEGKKKASMVWLGKNPTSQTDYADRR